LTNCIKSGLNENANPEEIRQAILSYQTKHCGDNSNKGKYVVIPGIKITEKEKSKIEEDRIARGNISLDLGYFTLENPIAGMVTLAPNELDLLAKNTLVEIASDLNLSFRTSDNKETLINTILNRE
jgi:hypothetical protein